jgi:RNA recognition motif-containing protein
VRSLFVGSLNYAVEDEDLVELFTEAGVVKRAKVIKDRDTGQSKGFGFVDMNTQDEMDRAIEKFNEFELQGRAIVVNYAKERSPAPRSY